ncbi:hypothetical protein P3T37_001415 [Kitasatospora sp. MAA4]|uniref:hypothetical protein n=1 Tax=Kitasatospora sp. MAA4 TaxID=3035093 RepID=UPI002476AD2F|nr:hypothetical protein [Kitasatospora sp. MAA4]MDH6132030.1 hypothetical protein [Kitasatospora sp. MAA4]
MEPMNDAGPAGPPAVEAPREPGMARRALTALYEIRIHTVFVLVAASLGLGLCAPQIETEWVVAIFAGFWAITVVAMIALAARMLEERPARGRHRRVTQS